MKKCVFLAMLIISVLVPCQMVKAMTVDELIEQYDFKKINETTNGIDFKELVINVIKNDSPVKKTDLKSQIVGYVRSEFLKERSSVLKIISIAIILAFFSNIAASGANQQIMQIGQVMGNIMLITTLLGTYHVTQKVVLEVLDTIVSFLKMLMPTYMTCIAVTGGNMSAIAFGEGAMLLVLVINLIYSKIVILGGNIYVLIMTCEGMQEGEGLEKLGKLVLNIMNWVLKTSMAIVVGLNIIKGMIMPLADGVQASMMVKAMKMIPGIGNGVGTVSAAVLGAGTLIKNGIGVAALIVICLFCLTPILKIGLYVIIYQFIGAILQPVTGKKTSDTIMGFVDGMKLMLSIVVDSAITIFLVIAIICMSTNMNYLA